MKKKESMKLRRTRKNWKMTVTQMVSSAVGQRGRESLTALVTEGSFAFWGLPYKGIVSSFLAVLLL